MAYSLQISFDAPEPAALTATEGVILALWRPGADGAAALSPSAAACDAESGGQVARALRGVKGERGDATVLLAPHGLAAEALILLCAGAAPLDRAGARRLGAAAAKALAAQKTRAATVRLDGVDGGDGSGSDADAEAGAPLSAAELAAEALLGLELRGYRFETYKSEPSEGALERLSVGGAAGLEAAHAPLAGLVAGSVMTRDLVNEPANTLTPPEFAARAKSALEPLGVAVEILDEAKLAELGMRALLAVGQGSRQPSSVVVMRWEGAADKAAAPLCLVGKGVCFDTGGVSLKPAAGMEEMTMDMGGAGVVVGAMRALAQRKSKANVVGLIGLVENMPDGAAQRPGDVVTSAAGKTIEVINTDAEGRLVLCDVLWYAQERFKPKAIVDLATLTGAIIISLGHEKAGLFANDDALAGALERAAADEGEGIWRMPLGDAYDKQLKSRIADMKNVGGRPAGAVTAAQFLQRFIRDGQPWAHIDIAGVALTKEDGPLWPRGASGWGVATLARWAETAFEA